MPQEFQSHRLEGRVALVTGGGTGIGRAAALAYSREGAKVVVAGRRSSEIDETVRLITASGGVGCAVPTDVAVAQQVRDLVDATVERFGRLDAAFNNAGIEGTIAPITELTETDFDEVIAINLRGAWLSIKYEIAAMLSLGNGGSIVNTSSFLAKGAAVGSTVYSASKGGLDALIRAVAIEYGPHNIRINNINPGAIRTPRRRSGRRGRCRRLAFDRRSPFRYWADFDGRWRDFNSTPSVRCAATIKTGRCL